MNKKATTLIVGAMIFALLAAFAVQQHINSVIEVERAVLADLYKEIEVVVPQVNLAKGQILSAASLVKRALPKKALPADVVLPEQKSRVVGRRLMSNLRAGDPLLFGNVSSARGEGLSSLIDGGRRALTFSVDIVSSVAGMLRPSDRIDLLATLRDGKNEKTIPLLSNVQILATGAVVDEFQREDPRGRFQTITLMLSPEDVSRITHAQEFGRLTVALRSSGDSSKLALPEMTTEKLLAPYRRRAASYNNVEIIRGRSK